MERTFSKPPAARQVEARARARTLGVKVAVVSEVRAVTCKARVCLLRARW